MLQLGKDPIVLVFQAQLDDAHMVVVQYNFSWEQAMLERLKVNKREASIVPGLDPKNSRYLFVPHQQKDAVALVEEFRHMVCVYAYQVVQGNNCGCAATTLRTVCCS